MSTYNISKELEKLNKKFDARAKKEDQDREKMIAVLGRIATALEAIAEPEVIKGKKSAAKLPKPGDL